jgi:hypothetical protein
MASPPPPSTTGACECTLSGKSGGVQTERIGCAQHLLSFGDTQFFCMVIGGSACGRASPSDAFPVRSQAFRCRMRMRARVRPARSGRLMAMMGRHCASRQCAWTCNPLRCLGLGCAGRSVCFLQATAQRAGVQWALCAVDTEAPLSGFCRLSTTAIHAWHRQDTSHPVADLASVGTHEATAKLSLPMVGRFACDGRVAWTPDGTLTTI